MIHVDLLIDEREPIEAELQVLPRVGDAFYVDWGGNMPPVSCLGDIATERPDTRVGYVVTEVAHTWTPNYPNESTSEVRVVLERLESL